MDKRVIIIGGGLGGLSASLYLAAHGFKVDVFEQNEKLGGKMNEYKWDKFRFDTGPTLITMPFIIDDLFSKLNLHRPDYLELELIDPICRYFWNDGTSIDMSSEINKSIEQLSRISEEDASSLKPYLKYAHRIYDISADLFLLNPIHEINTLMRWKTFYKLFHAYKIDPFRTVHNANKSFFAHPKTIQIFDRYATYNGSNPFEAPATLNIIPYVEYELGGYYIKGGMYRLVHVLGKLLKDMDINVHTSTKVDKIIHDNDRVMGVVVNGEKLKADYIICNSDVVSSFNTLIDGFEERTKKLNKLEPSISGLVFLWAVSKQYKKLAHHNIIFASNYEEEFRTIFKDKMAPEDPTIYISISSKADPAHATRQGENWFILINTPYLTEYQDWDVIRNHIRARIVSKLARTGIDDIEKHIMHEQVYSPLDFYNKYGSNRGSIYGISSNSRSSAFKRPPNRSRDLKGLYFAGGSTHPGGGVPLAILSGKICSDLIVERNT